MQSPGFSALAHQYGQSSGDFAGEALEEEPDWAGPGFEKKYDAAD